MRIYNNFLDAHGEIRRELKEMGIPVSTKTYQNKDIEGREEFATVEIQNYMYSVTEPRIQHLSPVQPWADAEWEEREAGILGHPVNPGEAYKLRPEVWDQFLDDMGNFDYTYSERFAYRDRAMNVITRLKQDPYSRQAFVPVFDAEDTERLGLNRVPCSLGYLFQFRRDQLDMTYFMRSCDWVTHFQNDVYLAIKLQMFVSRTAGLKRGWFSHYMGSLHVYNKDVEGAF